MFREAERIFKGISGTEYVFKIMSKNSEFDPITAIFILTYKHPRGHLSGFVVNPLFIGQTNNLKNELVDHPQSDCFFNECYNSIYVMVSDEKEDTRKDIVEDLLHANPTPCS